MQQAQIIEMAKSVMQGDRRALARAITLIESARADHRADAAKLLEQAPANPKTIRIGLSGTPGVGKSTFIESFGMLLADKGLRVAVLAIDPSSTRSGGSILGDKTRMERLTRHPNAFIRPSASQTHLGGVARRTREAADICSAAGYDVVLIETVGVGQSETAVAQMSDIFLLLLTPAGGDELQGVKRGIMEVADLVLINKADGDLKAQATRTCADYAGALRLLRKRPQDPDDFPKASLVSALHEQGMADVWEDVQKLAHWRQENGVWDGVRKAQAEYWFKEELQNQIMQRLTENKDVAEAFGKMQEQVKSGKIPPAAAAAQVADQLWKS